MGVKGDHCPTRRLVLVVRCHVFCWYTTCPQTQKYGQCRCACYPLLRARMTGSGMTRCYSGPASEAKLSLGWPRPRKF